MDYVTLGRTGLTASVVGLGCGGPSRLGQNYGSSQEESVAVVREALSLGITFIDTAEAYRTEEIVGRALKNVERNTVTLSTKKSVQSGLTGQEIIAGLDASLSRLGTDYVDIYHLHGVPPELYPFCVERLVPVLQELQEEGRIRFLGITERFGADVEHEMLVQALHDNIWDVVMVGFNILNQTARRLVLPEARRNNVGILNMFAVRRALSQPEKLREVARELAVGGQIEAGAVDLDDPLGFLVHPGGATGVPDAGYRFCRYEPGIHVVLSGTGNIGHLRENVKSLSRPPLPDADASRLRHLFRKVDSVTGG